MLSFESVTSLVPDFPKPGIQFVDMGDLLFNVKTRNAVLDYFVAQLATIRIDAIAGLESRGFLFGMALADRLQVPFVMVRKAGKLPPPVVKTSYSLEYGKDEFELQTGQLKPEMNVVLVDDILATGGSLLAAASLVLQLQAQVSAVVVLGDISPQGSQALQEFDAKLPVIQLPKRQDLVVEIPSVRTLPNPSKHLLLYHPSMQSVAEDMYSRCSHFDLGEVQWDKFPDGSPNLKIPTHLLGRRVVFLASMFNLEQWIEQLSVLMILGRQGVQSLDIIAPYYSTGTMERVEHPSDVATADTLAQITSCCMSPTIEGLPVLSIFDLHASTVRYCFSPKEVRYQPLTAIGLALQQMIMMTDDKFIVAFPDEGSYKRFRAQLPSDIPFFLFAKQRIGDQRKLQLVQSSCPDTSLFKHVLIMDDLVQSGGTLDECRRAVHDMGFPHISCFVTHAVFPKRSYLDFLPQGRKSGFENFWVTDSNPQISSILAHSPPFRVLPIAPLIIQSLHARRPFPMHDNIHIRLASTALVKKKSTLQLQEWFPLSNVFVSATDANSGVRNQPIGREEILRGALTRLKSCRYWRQVDNEFPNVNHYVKISMENGIVKGDDGNWFDIGVVIWETKEQLAQTVKYTRPIPIPTEIVEAALENKKTVGQVYHERFGYDPQDWHLPVSGMSRAFLLAEALAECVASSRRCFSPSVSVQEMPDNPTNGPARPCRVRRDYDFFSEPYQRFLLAELRAKDQPADFYEICKQTRAAWENLSTEEKLKYEILARDDQQRYAIQLAEFRLTNPQQTKCIHGSDVQ